MDARLPRHRGLPRVVFRDDALLFVAGLFFGHRDLPGPLARAA